MCLLPVIVVEEQRARALRSRERECAVSHILSKLEVVKFVVAPGQERAVVPEQMLAQQVSRGRFVPRPRKSVAGTCAFLGHPWRIAKSLCVWLEGGGSIAVRPKKGAMDKVMPAHVASDVALCSIALFKASFLNNGD